MYIYIYGVYTTRSFHKLHLSSTSSLNHLESSSLTRINWAAKLLWHCGQSGSLGRCIILILTSTPPKFTIDTKNIGLENVFLPSIPILGKACCSKKNLYRQHRTISTSQGFCQDKRVYTCWCFSFNSPENSYIPWKMMVGRWFISFLKWSLFKQHAFIFAQGFQTKQPPEIPNFIKGLSLGFIQDLLQEWCHLHWTKVESYSDSESHSLTIEKWPNFNISPNLDFLK